MKYVVTPEFATKAAQLDTTERAALSRTLALLEGASSEELLSSQNPAALKALDEGVYATSSGPLRVFVTFSAEEGEPRLILLDLAQLHRSDARSRLSLNPIVDPNRNPTINPNRNPTINPNRNPTINPNRNPTINPNRNPMINPNRNPMINPNRNPMINPNRNPTINPARNPSYSGPFIFDLSLDRVGFMVRANDDVVLTFDDASRWTGFCVKLTTGGYAQFKTTNEWVGHLVSAEKGMVQFDLGGNWIGFVA